METKDDLLAELCDLLAIPSHKTSVGSSIPRRFFSDILDYFDLPDEGDAVTSMKSLINMAGLDWEPIFSSENSPSGGGGTVTLSGLKALRRAVVLLLDEQEALVTQNLTAKSDKPDKNSWTLLPGQSLLRKKLHDTYGGIRQGGISPSNSTNNVFIFTDDATNREHGYEFDYWLDDMTFIYCGDGQSGNQKISNRNGTILNHVNHGRKLRLFSPVSGNVTYLCELEIVASDPYQIKRGIGRDGQPRNVIMFKLRRVITSSINKVNDSNITNKHKFGMEYKFANENPRDVQKATPFENDPNLLDRALQIHSVTQNIVANWVASNGLIPLSPSSETCDFDVAWESEFGNVVCEVKSITEENEVHQFRIGVGQVLEYAYSLRAQPVLMFSRRPKSILLIEMARSKGIYVLWPEILGNFDPRELRKTITN